MIAFCEVAAKDEDKGKLYTSKMLGYMRLG
jgi:hypothetical protein